MTLICTRCKIERSSLDFYKSKRTLTGFYERCKPCCKEDNAKNKASRKAYSKTLKGKLARRKYHQSDSYKEVQKNYHTSSKGLISLRVNTNRRKEKIKIATPPWVDKNEIKQFYKLALKLEQQTGVKHQVDHIIPLKHKDVCGLNVPWNLQILTESQNKVKANSFDGTYSNESWRVSYGISA